MTNLAIHRESCQAIALPEPRVPISIREAELSGGDVPFIDQLQRKHSRMVGWFPTKQIEGNIAKKRILIAEEVRDQKSEISEGSPVSDLTSDLRPLTSVPVGYCISSDRYFKRDDCGIVYQLNVTPGKQRGLIGASLIKAVFDRAAYGCKLFCCWCAQDLEANHFWESLGFVPLAFRTGSRSSGGAGSKKTPRPRIHIFWQRRIREGDGGAGATPYWFPSQTTGGAMGECRLVLPIPPGTHWSDAKPAILPGFPGMENVNVLPPGQADPSVKKTGGRTPKPKLVKPPAKPKGGLWFAPAPPVKGSPEAKQLQKAEKPKRPRAKFKNDPKVVEAARELRDRYIDEINAPGGRLLPPSGGACGKYDVSRQLEAAPSFRGPMKVAPVAMLEAA